MQQKSNPNSFNPQAPPLNQLNQDTRANPAAAQPQRAQAPPLRPAGPPVHVGSLPGRVPPQQHIPYAHPAPQYNHGHQGRRAVPQQQAPGPAGYYSGSGYVNPTAALNPYAPNYMNSASNFAMASPYNNFPPYRGPAGPVPQTAMGAPQPIQGRDYHPSVVPHQHRLQPAVQPRKSKALAIVNPETKQEIIVKKQAETKPIPQVSPPVRKPLEVVRPSDDSEKPEASAPKPIPEKTSTPVAVSEPNVMKAKVAVSSEKVHKAAAPVEDKVKESTAVKSTASGDAPKIVDKVNTSDVSDKELPVSRVTENKLEPSEKSSSSLPSSDRDVPKAPIDAKPVPVEKIETDDTKEEKSTEAPLSEKNTSSVTAVQSSNKTESGGSNVAQVKTTESSTENADNAATGEVKPAAPPSPPKRERPASPVWTKGSRRTYAITYLHQMRVYADKARSEEYDKLLCRHNVSKSQRGARNDIGRPGRSGDKMLRDPRGTGYLGPTSDFSRGAGVLGGGMGAQLNLRNARNRRPPQESRGQSAKYDDPRGTRTQEGGRRGQGPMRGGPGPLDPYEDYGPVERLQKSDNHWSRKKEDDSELEAKVKQTRSLLNKLTLEKFEKITGQILAVELCTPDEAQAIVAEIFEKTLFEPKFAGMYAMLCRRLDVATKTMFEKTNYKDKNGKPMTFRKVLLKLCQIEFHKASESAKSAEEEKKPGENEAEGDKPALTLEEQEKAKKAAEAEAERKRVKAKRRSLGNIRFIGELYLVDLITEGIIHKHCIQALLSTGIKTKEEETLEALAKLMTGVGKKISQTPAGPNLINEYFKRIKDLAQDYSLPARIRFFLQDLIEMRDNGWKQRREEASAKTISEIHRDIEKEERAKAEQQAANRMRQRGSGGGNRDRRGGGRDYPPMQMTMGTPRTSQNTSRSSAQLDRYVNRMMPGRQLSGNLNNVPLRPGGPRSSSMSGGANGWSSVGGSRSRQQPVMTTGSRSGSSSLRPTLSRFTPLAPSVDTSSSVNDARRSGKGGAAGAGVKPSGPKEPELKSDEIIKKKSRSLMTEFWETKNEEELKGCFVDEVGAVNGLKFTEFCIREALNAKISLRNEGVPYFKLLLTEGLIPPESLTSAFSAVISDLDDITMDDPRASEFVARYLAGIFSTGKLGVDGKTGLEFMKSALSKTRAKTPVKFVLLFLSEFNKMLETNGEEEGSRKQKLVAAFKAADVDLVVAILNFNAMRGIGALEDMLKDYSLSFIYPELNVDKAIVSGILAETPGQAMLDNLKGLGVELELTSAAFASKVVTRAFAIYFSNVDDKIAEKLIAGPGELIKLCHKGESPPVNTQMTVLLAIQPFLSVVGRKDPEMEPLLADEYKAKKLTHGYITFDALYDAEIVEEDTFMKWKADDSPSVMAVGGKPEVLLQTASWYTWLETAAEE